MNAVCPHCTESDRTVSVPHALTDTGDPLPATEHGLLLPPPPPPPVRATAERSRPAMGLYIAAAVVTALWLKNLAGDLSDLQDASPAYRLGYLLGPLFLSVPLAVAGLVVQLSTRRRRVMAGEDGAAKQLAVWERRHRVWQAAWLCRRCRVAFFPMGAISPGFPASPPIAVAQLPMWVTATAEREFGVPEPAARKSATAEPAAPH
ncbi:hypothetical protein [Kitasatospora sp. MBT63]|uniref:hypothetical protein n=1 Tax=Kitasatospora sp. MBT63 TaxID=1444768 RepID=UPI00053B3176|nr:hypothetical protein [Kitasatospora sp. MBT63]